MAYNSQGYLKIRSFIASEALPVSDVFIRIYGNEEANNGIDYSIKTGSNGLSETIELPAPDETYSLAPNPSEQAYATYNIEISADGYYPKLITNVSVFSGILSILPIELVPDAGLIKNTPPPSSTNFSIIQENEELA